MSFLRVDTYRVVSGMGEGCTHCQYREVFNLQESQDIVIGVVEVGLSGYGDVY